MQQHLDTVTSHIGNVSPVVRYMAERSTTLDHLILAGNFVKVINSNTPEFNIVGGLVDIVPFDSLLEYMLGLGLVSSDRGNTQQSFGYNCGVSQVRNPSEDFGCAMPTINADTDRFLFLFPILSGIAKKMGVAFADPSFVDASISCKKRFQRFARRFHSSNCFEGFTIAILDITNLEEVKEHCDTKNDPDLTETLVVSKILWFDKRLLRVTIIAFLRVSCRDAMVRRDACEEACRSCRTWIESLDAHLMPGAPIDQYAGLSGSHGLTVVGDAITGHIVCAALLSPPTPEKQVHLLSAATHAIYCIYESRPGITLDSLVELALPIVYCNNLFTYVTALFMIATNPNLNPNHDLGFYGLVIELIVSISGSISGGPFRRCQCFVSRPIWAGKLTYLWSA